MRVLRRGMFIKPNVEPVDDKSMADNKHVDIAQEPVDLDSAEAFTDTGVLHEDRICAECGNDHAAQGYRFCTDCLQKLKP